MRTPLEKIYMKTAILFSERATCNRKKVGGVLVLDGRIIATGYCGSPSKTDHCIDVGCEIQIKDGRESCVRTVHCEMAIISFCARHGLSTLGTELFITLCPCYECAKVLINAGIKKVFYLEEYSGKSGKELLKNNGIECIQYKEV
jgi:dCMP deaminase